MCLGLASGLVSGLVWVLFLVRRDVSKQVICLTCLTTSTFFPPPREVFAETLSKEELKVRWGDSSSVLFGLRCIQSLLLL
jgi:hypothetical protein